jgi:hypothetical protein
MFRSDALIESRDRSQFTPVERVAPYDGGDIATLTWRSQ